MAIIFKQSHKAICWVTSWFSNSNS